MRTVPRGRAVVSGEDGGRRAAPRGNLVSVSLQRLVDEIAIELDASVAVFDRTLALVAYSVVGPAVDPVRVESILTRVVTTPVRAWVESLRLNQASAPIAVLPPEGVSMGPRVVAPLWFAQHLVGSVWVTVPEHDGPSAARISSSIARQQERLAQLLHDQVSREAPQAAAEARTFAALLSDRPDDRSQAGADLQMDPSDHVVPVALVARGEVTSNQLEVMCAEGRRRFAYRRPVGRVMSGTAYLLVPVRAGTVEADTRSVTDAARASGSAGAAGDVGIGVGLPAAPGSALREQVSAAEDAARVALADPGSAGIVWFGSLGLLRVASAFRGAGIDLASRAPEVARLFARASAEQLQTLESYLDNAGDVQRTAASLTVHRATLYYRLRRIEELLEASLDDGELRSLLHLALKVRSAGVSVDASETAGR